MPAHPEIPMSPALVPPRPVAWWMLLLVALLAAGAYANSVKNGYAYDDLGVIKNNAHVLNQEWTTIWTDNYWPSSGGRQPDTLYRPLTLWSYLANQALAPDSPGPFHFVNVALHTLISVLVSLLAWRLVGNRIVALVSGILFAVHPLHTEAVANTVGRAELLAALWSLLALLIFLPPTPLKAEAGPQRPREWWHGPLVAVCFLAALLSKETPATLILALPLIDAWRWLRWSPDSRPRWYRWAGRQILRYHVPMAAVFGGYLFVRNQCCGLMADSRVIHHVINPLMDANVWQRIVTPFTLLAKYLLLTLWPVHLSADYSAPSLLPTTNLMYATGMQPPAILGIMVCVLAILLCVFTWRKFSQVLLLAGLFVLSYFLVSNVIRIGTIFGERLFYWPSVFALIMIAWAAVAGFQTLLAKMPETRGRLAVHIAGVTLLAIPTGLMIFRTYIRNTDWADNIPLAISTARDNPESGKACSWAGATLVLTDDPAYVEFGKALIERAIELSPDYSTARWELARFYGLRHQLGESAVCVAQAARLDPGSPMTRVAIPALIEDLKKADPSAYVPVIEGYFQEHPDEDAASLAMAFACHAQGRFDAAEQYARRALDLSVKQHSGVNDQFHEAGAELAAILFDRGTRDGNPEEIANALDKFRLYLAFLPNSVEGRLTLASMLLSVDPREYPLAISEAQGNIRAAEAIEPHSPRVRDMQGRLNRIAMSLSRTTVTASVLLDFKTEALSPAAVGP